MDKLRVLDLFSGIGGFSLGLERTGGFDTIAFCEIDPYCQKVLKKHWPDVPIYEDIRTLNEEVLGNTKQQRGESGGLQQEDKPEALQGRDSLDTPIPAGKGARNAPTSNDREPIYADVITGGYPCQPFSNAGKRRGAEDDRHLWPQMFRLITEVRPTWIICENVTGHINMGLDQVLSDLEGEGYACRTFVLPACAVDAPHRRDRVWIIANTESCGGNRAPNDASPSPQRQNGKQTQQSSKHGKIQSVSNTGLPEPQGRGEPETDHDRCSGAGIQEGSESSSSCSSVADPNSQRKPQQEGIDQNIRGWAVNGSEASSQDVGNTERDGLSTSSLTRSHDETSGSSKAKGAETARKSEGASRSRHDENVADPSTVNVPWQQPEFLDQKIREIESQRQAGSCGDGFRRWAVEPAVGRVADGIPGRVAQLKALGNAVVPQIPEILGRAILEAENEKQKAISSS
tara:strand:- start:43 stop:1416 length:1374 start_codon:yes stop_codon:yes gene_type:complete